MPNLEVGALIIRSQMFCTLWEAAFWGLNVPKIECYQNYISLQSISLQN